MGLEISEKENEKKMYLSFYLMNLLLIELDLFSFSDV